MVSDWSLSVTIEPAVSVVFLHETQYREGLFNVEYGFGDIFVIYIHTIIWQ